MSAIKPMLASPATDIPLGDDHVIEPKFDGWRATFQDGDFRTRTGKAITNIPYLSDPIRRALEGLPAGTVLDGEIVDLAGETGKEWNRTQSILSRNKIHSPGEGDPALTYVVFDVLEAANLGEPLRARRKMLPLMVRLIDSPNIIAVESAIVGDERASAVAAYNKIVEDGYEGAVVKDLESAYAPGMRNGAWVKIKPELEMDVEVTGTYAPEVGSKYEGKAVGGIEFRATHPDGSTYDGRAAGMDDELRTRLHVEPEAFIGKVAVVAYASVAEDTKALRFPRFKRFRDESDKSVSELPQNAHGAKMMLLERALEAERERDELKTQVSRLRERLEAFLGDEAVGGDRLRDEIRRQAASPPTIGTHPPAPMHVQAPPIPVQRSTIRAPKKPRMRNYKAMGAQKLSEALTQLEANTGDAYQRAASSESQGGPTVGEHLAMALTAAREKGLR